MKTKALLAFVALFSLCALRSSADSYSRTLVPGGYVLVANDLENQPIGNAISNLFSSVLGSVTVYKFDSTYQRFYQPPVAETLDPGQGALVNCGGRSGNLVFSGTQPSAAPPLALGPGRFYLLGRRSGGLGVSSYEDLVGAPPVEGSLLLRFSAALQDFIWYSYRSNQWSAPLGTPQIGEGESAFVVLQPALVVTNSAAGRQVVSWDAPSNWFLESSVALGGPWITITNAPNPYVAPLSVQGQQFYRLRGAVPLSFGISLGSR